MFYKNIVPIHFVCNAIKKTVHFMFSWDAKTTKNSSACFFSSLLSKYEKSQIKKTFYWLLSHSFFFLYVQNFLFSLYLILHRNMQCLCYCSIFCYLFVCFYFHFRDGLFLYSFWGNKCCAFKNIEEKKSNQAKKKTLRESNHKIVQFIHSVLISVSISISNSFVYEKKKRQIILAFIRKTEPSSVSQSVESMVMCGIHVHYCNRFTFLSFIFSGFPALGLYVYFFLKYSACFFYRKLCNVACFNLNTFHWHFRFVRAIAVLCIFWLYSVVL